jgi:competence protein ComEC
VALPDRLGATLAAQQGHLFAWLPVCLGAGIGTYFALPSEPALWQLGTLAGLAAGLALAARVLRARPLAAPLLLAAAVMLAGLALAGFRAQAVAAPVLGFRYYGPVEGRIVAIDRSASDRIRLTLAEVRLDRVAPARTPARVRVALHGEQGWTTPEPGQRVMLTGHLAPPGGPVEPGGYDFQRQAWFAGIGAVGYTRTPLMVADPAPEGLFAPAGLFRLRMRISAAVQAALPGPAGAVAAAVTTGDRSAIPAETTEALRRSNLAHLLAISGLHMGLLTGFVFGALRLGLAALPATALHWPTKKIAAAAAIAAGAAYYALSGGNVATERAFVMVTVMLAAILFDRRALTLRAVALAALVVLILRPESLTGPGFQMSFAATAALVGVFGALRDREGWRPPRWTRPVLAVVLSSAVAGAATAPVAAAHFNRIADYGLLANLLSVPLMGLVVMPAAVLAACLAPVGLHMAGLMVMRPALDWILGVAHWVAGLPGAVTHVPAPPAGALPLLAAGGLVLLLWQGRLRWAGVVPAAVAAFLWIGAERPPLLVSPDGGLVGVMTETGRALNKPRGQGFAARVWLENDGDGADQDKASRRGGIAGDDGMRVFRLGDRAVVQLSGRGAAARAAAACAGADLVILAAEAEGPAPCRVLDRIALRETGALAVYPAAGGLRLVTARAVTGRRIWNAQ